MYSIDRIEGGYAVVEAEEEMLNLPLADLPENVKEGDVLRKTDNGWEIDEAGTQERHEKLLARRRRLTGGDGA